jgi:LysM repeat protein
MQWLRRMELSEPTTYTVRVGDTCFSIANRFGLSISQIIDLNVQAYPELRSNNCDVLYEGQVLTVRSTREELAYDDLNCDGQSERVVRLLGSLRRWVGIGVQSLQPNGIYRDSALFLTEETGRQISSARLQSKIDCGKFIILQVGQGPVLGADFDPRLVVLDWDAQRGVLQQLLSAPGELVQVSMRRDGGVLGDAPVLSVRQVQPEAGACRVETTEYRFQADLFLSTGSQVEVMASCP